MDSMALNVKCLIGHENSPNVYEKICKMFFFCLSEVKMCVLWIFDKLKNKNYDN